MRFDFAIIGGGLTATAMLCQLVSRVQKKAEKKQLAPSNIRISIQLGHGKEITKSSNLYAVGAMTRGQIIDASMARGIVKATSRIADDLVHYLTRICGGEIAETK
ncbi:MAG: hypothetical protein V2J65_03185 [Desulfobacteraceae bacterium]|jgi:uncharacterized NAD(P)/FAD-binding protein YdhS|nr:hypothetical protein [Desulfobacteraceae bacterium]